MFLFFLLLCTLNLKSEINELSMEFLAHPTSEKKIAAQKIRQLFIFDERLYIGHGDATSNTGPTDVISYDIKSGELKTEFTVDDEGIQTYKIVDGKLVIPGLDATESWQYGNFYILEDDGWKKKRTIPGALHVYDIVSYKGNWFTVTGSSLSSGKKVKAYCGLLMASSDRGESWINVYSTNNFNGLVNRINSAVVYKDKLYTFQYAHYSTAAQFVPTQIKSYFKKPFVKKNHQYYILLYPEPMMGPDTLVFDGSSWKGEDIIPEKDLCVVGPHKFKDWLILKTLSGKQVLNQVHIKDKTKVIPGVRDSLWKFDGESTKKVNIDYTTFIDMVSDENKLYLLCYTQEGVRLAISEDLNNWQWFKFNGVEGSPLSIEIYQNILFLGTEEGKIYSSKL